MFPPIGFRRAIAPDNSRLVDHPEVPCWVVEPFDEGLHSCPNPLITVPVVMRVWAAHELHRVGDILLLGSQLSGGDDVGREIRLPGSLYCFVDFGGPPKTDPSRRSDKKHQPHMVRVRVELRPEGF